MLSQADGVADLLGEVRLRLGRGDAATESAVQLSGHYLGVLLQNLAAAYDPECIVLGGSVAELGAAFVEPALQALHAYAQAAGLEPPTVRTSHFGADAVAVGAAALVRYSTTRPLHAVDVRGATEPAEG
jgi:predicted NBD/HSP70 family sugar kinase